MTVIFPMLIGAIAYYTCCPSVWFVQKLDLVVGSVSRQPIIPQGILKVSLRCYFFDYIWAFSLSNAIYISYQNSIKTMVIAVIITVVLGSLLEIMQLLGITTGTFDIFDIWVELIGSLSGVYIIKSLRRINRNEKD